MMLSLFGLKLFKKKKKAYASLSVSLHIHTGAH